MGWRKRLGLLTQNTSHEKLSVIVSNEVEQRKIDHGCNTYRFFESAVLENPPDTRINSEIFPKVEKGLQSHSGSVQGTLDVTRYTFGGVLVRLDSHDAVPKVAPEKEVLPQASWVLFGHGSYCSIIGCCELDGKRAVQGKIFADQLRLLGDRCGKGSC